jgi:hypothetical protein
MDHFCVFGSQHEFCFGLRTIHEIGVKIQILVEVDNFLLAVTVYESDVDRLEVDEIFVFRCFFGQK